MYGFISRPFFLTLQISSCLSSSLKAPRLIASVRGVGPVLAAPKALPNDPDRQGNIWQRVEGLEGLVTALEVRNGESGLGRSLALFNLLRLGASLTSPLSSFT